MLDQETKRRIDSARDILVGKVPDPKAQVEQITTALIYKFMDDMDSESEELGGKAKFFTGKYKQYAWSKLMDSKLGGHDRLNLYVEAITSMGQNPHLPQLFRNIFKDAFLPYRDPETLSLFLKEINGFIYDHSERLGDAFEYLLSVLGSQGEAGQFRTPRHIIDFMTNVIDPKKDETVLDPACGTAGFLISAYKHILKANRKKPLTPSEKTKLMNQFVGYDISPDMVRLSLVNMYLHSFPNPNIYEYDTLTSEERWDETYDVILANPPFMTPKGGIRPHKRFSVQANRSEVLFVDYIAEHLNVNGRAGIIVPEGVIYRSGNVYGKLRKMLIDDGHLYCIISLPSGVFNPYAGTKTDILLLDKSLAKKSKDILYIKIRNDGYDLGAQRVPIIENDLPEALRILQDFKQSLGLGEDFNIAKGKSDLAYVVSKRKISENRDYNLLGERYKDSNIGRNKKWEMVDLGSVCDVLNGSTPLRSNAEYWENGTIPWFTIMDLREQGEIIRSTGEMIAEKALRETSVKLLPKDAVLICCTASVGEVAITKIRLTTNQQFNGLVIKKEYQNRLLPEFLFIIAKNFKNELMRISGKTSFDFISGKILKSLQIPLPPIKTQKEIVANIKNEQRKIDKNGRTIEIAEKKISKQVLEVWRG